ncbi:uncharacterized protein METZ01_LOCUS154719 [marine metagenome]|uniref:Uncharacterized protein n=1 Tax=marine metagenome TaxID=408172 RepID=A0A382AJV9_9ZZZZ
MTYKSFQRSGYLACGCQFLEDQLKQFSCNQQVQPTEDVPIFLSFSL